MTEVLGLRGITKRFGAVEALRDATFSLNAGEIHGLLGENGAGKSTLMRIAYGLVRADTGTIAVDGVARPIRSPFDARALGLGMVHQHFTSIPAFTVLENVALAAGWAPKASRIGPRLEALMSRLGLELDPDARAGDLSAGLKQRLEVLQALSTDARILLLDEPSAVLSPEEADGFLERVRALRDAGVAAVLITHKLDEALRVADRVTVLRRGTVVHSSPATEATVATLATAMLGEEPPAPTRLAARSPGDVRARLDGVFTPRLGATGSGLRGATLEIRAGEIVGLAAIEGNGQREVFRLLSGLATPARGTVSAASPVSFVPEDRTHEGTIRTFTLTENLVLARGEGAPWLSGPWVDWGRAESRMTELINAFDIRTPGPGTQIGRLSGGNQQRVMLAAALDRNPAVLLAENPTRGLDIRGTAEVHARLHRAADAGVAVLVHLPDLDELLSLADRIIVLTAGVSRELRPGAARAEVGRALLATG